MSEDSPGENNIESLAERAKEMLDRVRAHSDEPFVDEFFVLENEVEAAFTEDPIVEIDVEDPAVGVDVEDHTDVENDETIVDEIEVIDTEAPNVTDDVEDSDVAEAEVLKADVEAEVLEVEADVLDDELLSELDDAWATDSTDGTADEKGPGYVAPLGVPPEMVDDAPDELVDIDALEPEEDVAPSTVGVAAVATSSGVEHLFAEDSDENDAEDGGRRFGGLIPLVLLALFVLSLSLFVASLLGSNDDDDQAGPTLVDEPDDVDESSSTEAAPTTETATTTEAPPETSSTETTAEPEPEPTIPDTAWELLGEATGTAQFAVLGGPLGLQEALEASVDDDGNPIEFTFFAPSDAAIQALTPEQLAAIAQDPAAAEALVGYHFVDQRLTPELLFESVGSQLQTRSGLPIDVSLDGDEVVLNGNVRLSLGLVAGNGEVIVIDGVLQPPTLNQVLELGTIQFEVRSSVIAPAGEAELSKAVAYFTENPDVSALIEGHTDTDGPSEPNQRLSNRRANAVRDFLISQGIDASRLEAVGLGESEPIMVNGVEDKVASRRIEFEIR